MLALECEHWREHREGGPQADACFDWMCRHYTRALIDIARLRGVPEETGEDIVSDVLLREYMRRGDMQTPVSRRGDRRPPWVRYTPFQFLKLQVRSAVAQYHARMKRVGAEEDAAVPPGLAADGWCEQQQGLLVSYPWLREADAEVLALHLARVPVEQRPAEYAALSTAAFEKRVSRVREKLLDHDVWGGKDSFRRVQQRCVVVGHGKRNPQRVRRLLSELPTEELASLGEGKTMYRTSDWPTARRRMRAAGSPYRCWHDLVDALKRAGAVVKKESYEKQIPGRQH